MNMTVIAVMDILRVDAALLAGFRITGSPTSIRFPPGRSRRSVRGKP